MFVKICGIKSLEELFVVEKYANATGVVVECESRRRIPVEVAKLIVENAEIPVFIVSTLESLEDWASLIERTDASHVQIHSNAGPEAVDRVREMGVSVMKAFRVPKNCPDPETEARKLVERIEEYKTDYVLLDTGKGSGEIHDHRVSRAIARKFNVVLAGGLNPENVAGIVDFVKPLGVDISSGVETAGRKDERKIRRFVKALSFEKRSPDFSRSFRCTGGTHDR